MIMKKIWKRLIKNEIEKKSKAREKINKDEFDAKEKARRAREELQTNECNKQKVNKKR